MATYRLTIAYDGTPFAGWAAQPGQRTVQGELEAALERILGERARSPSPGAPTPASTPGARWRASSSTREPPDGARPPAERRPARRDRGDRGRPAADGFDARRDARSRTYCYRVLASPVRDPFERGQGAVVAAPRRSGGARALCRGRGRHPRLHRLHPDRHRARALRARRRSLPSGGPTVWPSPFPGELLELWIEADAFMRHMVRVLVGTMLEVARRQAHARGLRGAPRGRAARARRGDGAAARPLPGLGSLLSAQSSAGPSSTSPRLAGRPGRYIDEPVAEQDRLALGVGDLGAGDRDRPPAVDHLGAGRRGRLPSGATGRRKFAFRSRPAIADPGGRLRLGRGQHREVGQHRDHPALEPPRPGSPATRVAGSTKVAVPSPTSVSRRPGQVVERRRRELAGELAAQDLRARTARTRPPAGWSPPGAGARMGPASRSRGARRSAARRWLGRIGSAAGRPTDGRSRARSAARCRGRARRPPTARPTGRRGSPVRGRSSVVPGRAGRRNDIESSAVV